MAYSDLTTQFSPGDLLIWQHFDQFAENDIYNYLPSGTKMLFFQAAAPTGWTQVGSGHNNKALRAVDGGGAGGVDGGGAYLLGTAITLAHTHTTPGHTHTYTHDHALETEVDTVTLSPKSGVWISSADSDGAPLREDSSAADTARHTYLASFKTIAPTSGSDSPSTSSSLSDITIKYFDAMICSKT